jgi:hypothetical protein
MRLEKFRNSMPPVLTAASAFAVVGRCRAPAHFLQRPAVLGTMLSQRSAGLVSLQHKLHLCKERLQLLRLAAFVDRSGRSSACTWTGLHYEALLQRCCAQAVEQVQHAVIALHPIRSWSGRTQRPSR